MSNKAFSILTILLLFLNSLVIAADGQKIETLESVTLQLKWKHQFQFAGYYAALEQGYYQQEGLAVDIKPLVLGTDVVKQVVSGSIQYAIGGSGILLQYAKGSPIKALAAIFQHDALVFISKQSSAIIGPYEMAGKHIQFDGLTGDNAPLHALLAAADLTSDKYTLAPAELGSQSFINDQVDVMSAYLTDQPFTLKQQGIKLNIINPLSYGFDFYGDILYTSQAELANYPGRAERFKRASLNGWAYALEHSEELIQLIKHKYHSELSIEALRYEAKQMQKLILPNIIPIGHIEVSRLRGIADIYAKLGMSKMLSDRELKNFILTAENTAVQFSKKEQQWLAMHPVIKVGVDRDFAPYEWVDKDGKYQGLAADYMALLEKQLGVTFDIIYDKPWYEIQEMAARGELDMLSCVNSTPQKEKYLMFTSAYVTNLIVIINTNIKGYLGSLERLSGQTIAVEKGYFTHEKSVNEYPDIHLLLVDSTHDALIKVATGEADAYLGDAAHANYAIKKGNLLNLQFAGQIEDISAYHVGVVKPNSVLLSIVSKVLNNVTEQQRDAIKERWMGLTVKKGIDLKTVFYIAIVAGLVILLLLYLYFNTRQSRQILHRSLNRLQAVLDASPIPHALNDHNNNITYVNTAFEQTFGYRQMDIPTLNDWWTKAYPDKAYREKVKTSWKQKLDSSKGSLQPMQLNIRCQNGETRHVSINSTTISDFGDELDVVILFDLTEHEKSEESLRLYARIFSETNEGLLVTDVKGEIEQVNPAFTRMTGYSFKDVKGKNPRLLGSGKHTPEFYKKMWQQLNDKGYWHGEVWNRKKSGELYAELLTISSLKDEQGEIKHYVGLFSDITESKKQQSILETMAHYDVLTQLPNRTLFADRFSHAISHSKRNNTMLAVCFIDLDNFKPVNDTYGHDVGDSLLIEVADRIQKTIREEDTISRQGGDEFALLLGDLSSVQQCEQMLVRLHKSLAEPYLIEDNTLNISASSGITLFPKDNGDIDTLMRHADQAMYKSKLSGKNRYHIFNTDDDLQIIEKHHQLDEIRQALINNEMKLFYQPKVNMKTGHVFGAEALIRWIHPQKGLIPPLDFLPILEGTEVEIQLGEWVITQALQQLNEWQNQGIEIEVSVNISSHHLQSALFFSQLYAILEKHPDVYSKKLELEILESSALGDINAISHVINACQETLGVKVALDDFGTGYSSLTHLRNLSAEVIKIDQSFVRDMLDDPSDYAIIDGVIGLAESFARQVIAEGVETSRHGLLLLTMGCINAQGYGISRPMPANKMPEWLKNYSANEEWLCSGRQEYSVKQKKIKILSLTNQHWLECFEEALFCSQEKNQNWPPSHRKKCHHIAWILREQKEALFDGEWLNRLEQTHQQAHQLASQLVKQYQMGEIAEARARINELRALFESIDNVLGQYE